MAASGNSRAATGSAAATAVAPLTLAHWAGFQLSFGRFAVNGAGTVTVNATTGAGATSGGATFVTGSTTATDRFIASGDPGRSIGIVTGGGVVTAGTSSMSFTTTPMLASGLLPPNGSGYFTVGGTLAVSAGQPGGNYTGSYVVSVAYN
ncbi:MAG: DUF4402 domain-containing protein [Sphingomonadales bacterium]|nr:DUF4402 domain-containing protein [Sphingomonadales bacterium]